MTRGHAATLRGQDSSFKWQLKCTSALPTPFDPLSSPCLSSLVPGFPIDDVVFSNTEK